MTWPASCSFANWERRTWSSVSFRGDSASAASIVSILLWKGRTWKSVAWHYVDGGSVMKMDTLFVCWRCGGAGDRLNPDRDDVVPRDDMLKEASQFRIQLGDSSKPLSLSQGYEGHFLTRYLCIVHQDINSSALEVFNIKTTNLFLAMQLHTPNSP